MSDEFDDDDAGSASYGFHPLADEYPLMSEAELDDLARHIGENGQEYPVVLWHDGTADVIIDGRNRYLACGRAGVPCRFERWEGPAERLQEKIIGLNEKRRHETPEARERRKADRVARVAEARKAGESLRAIAEREGVSESQVRADIGTATAQGCAVEPEGGKVKGRDGRTRNVGKGGKGGKGGKKKPTPEQHEQEQHEAGEAVIAAVASGGMPPEVVADVEEETEVTLDEFGQSVPAAFLKAWSAREEMAELATALHRALLEVSRLSKENPGAHQLRAATQLRSEGGRQFFRLEHLDTAHQKVKLAIPFTICPYCWHAHPGEADPDCKPCGGSGVVSKLKFDGADEARRLAVKNRDEIASAEAGEGGES